MALALKISVYQPRVSEPVAPVVQETGETIAPGISALARGAGQAAQATLMKIKQIEIRTQTEEGILAQTAATNEFLDRLKKNPIYPAIDENTGMLPGYPSINPRKEDGTFKDREELHAEVLDQYFLETDSGIQSAPLNPRARENIQTQFNRQKVQVADQVRDQMIADDLATLRQRQMDLIKTSQELGDVNGADALTREGMYNGFFTEAQKIAMDNQTRIMAAEGLANEIASAAFSEEFETRPAVSLASGIAAVDSEELKQLLADRDLGGYYNAATRQKVKDNIRRQYQERVNQGNALVSEASVEFRKDIHKITSLTNIPALRDRIMDDSRLSFFADEWREQQRLLNLLDAKEQALIGRGSRKKLVIDPRFWEAGRRRDAGIETIERDIYRIEADLLASARETMTPDQLAVYQADLNEQVMFMLRVVKARAGSNDPRGDVYEEVDNHLDAILRGVKDPEKQQLLRARANHMKEVLPALHNELWYQGTPPEEIYRWLDRSVNTLFDSPLEITSKRQFNNVISDAYYGAYGVSFVADEIRGAALTDGALIVEEQLKTQGVTGYPDTRTFIPYIRQEDGEEIAGEIFLMQGEVDGEIHWFMPDPQKKGRFRIYDPDPNNPNQTIEDLQVYVPSAAPRENSNFSPEQNIAAQISSMLDHHVGVHPVAQVFSDIKTADPQKSDEEIRAIIQNNYREKLRRNIQNWIQEYDDTSNSRGKRNAARNNLLQSNIEYGIRFYGGRDAVEMIWEEMNDEFHLDHWAEENPRITRRVSESTSNAGTQRAEGGRMVR